MIEQFMNVFNVINIAHYNTFLKIRNPHYWQITSIGTIQYVKYKPSNRRRMYGYKINATFYVSNRLNNQT